ncbi:hypothetical protein LCGC14_2297480, partial [marine sediment metagenome]
ESLPWILGGTDDEEALKSNIARFNSEIDRQLQFIEARVRQFSDAVSEPVELPKIIAPEFNFDDLILGDIDFDFGDMLPQPKVDEVAAKLQAVLDAWNATNDEIAAIHEVVGDQLKGIDQLTFDNRIMLIDALKQRLLEAGIEEVAATQFIEDQKNQIRIAAAQKTLGNINMVVGATNKLGDQLLARDKARIQTKLSKDIEAINNSTKSEEEKAAAISNLREQAILDEQKAAKKIKPIKIAQAIASTAVGVTNALSATVPPFNFALAALVAAAGAVEIATIKAQPFQFGGRPDIGSPALVGEAGRELFVPDEAGTIIPNDETENILGGGDTFNINLSFWDGDGVERIIMNNLEGFSRAFQEAKRLRFIE